MAATDSGKVCSPGLEYHDSLFLSEVEIPTLEYDGGLRAASVGIFPFKIMRENIVASHTTEAQMCAHMIYFLCVIGINNDYGGGLRPKAIC
jgi:hypothetical protein